MSLFVRALVTAATFAGQRLGLEPGVRTLERGRGHVARDLHRRRLGDPGAAHARSMEDDVFVKLQSEHAPTGGAENRTRFTFQSETRNAGPEATQVG